MLKNKLYQYGGDEAVVPAHLHFGKEAVNRMISNKDTVALINSETDERMTYLEMAQRTADIALSLTRMGVRKGDVVSVCSEKRFEVLPTIMGIICAGAAFSPTDLTYGSFPLLHRLKISRPKFMFCSKTAFRAHKPTFEEAESIERYIMYDNTPNGLTKYFKPLKSGRKVEATLYTDFLRPAVLDDFDAVPVDGWTDNMLILFSSGTTGLPKGMPVTHLSFLVNWQCLAEESYKGSCILNTREWYYTYGLMYTLTCLMIGATVVYSPTGEEDRMLEAVQKYKIHVMQMTPSSIMELVKSAILDSYDVSSVRHIVSSSTPVNKDLTDAIKKRFPNIEIIQLYGMTEAGCVCTNLGAAKGSKPGSSGVPGLGFIIKVVDFDTWQPLGPNQRGEICIMGPSVTNKYLDNVCPDFKDEEGFLKTGDVGYYDDDGYFFIIDRIKELIKFNDISIAPAEFEALLHQHPAVREAGVVGAKHPTHGEAPVAFVALQPGATATGDELVNYINSRVTYRMRLAGGVRFVDQLPRGGGAKLDRKALRRMIPNTDIVQLYGMSEGGSICTELGAPKGSKAGSSGLPCRGFIMKVVDLETREPLGPNQRGEICYKGPSRMKEYLHNMFPDFKDEDVFLKTGDVGYYDEDGYFFIVYRIKELIKFNDYAVAPAELEALLHQHPAVREAGVVGAKHPTYGEAPLAFVALQPGATATSDELVAFVDSQVSSRMRLAGGVRFVDQLPRGGGDKLDRKALKAILEA